MKTTSQAHYTYRVALRTLVLLAGFLLIARYPDVSWQIAGVLGAFQLKKSRQLPPHK